METPSTMILTKPNMLVLVSANSPVSSNSAAIPRLAFLIFRHSSTISYMNIGEHSVMYVLEEDKHLLENRKSIKSLKFKDTS